MSQKISHTLGENVLEKGQKTLLYPINCFSGAEDNIIIANDVQKHGKDLLNTMKLADCEIKEIIEPVLASPYVSENVKKYLKIKKRLLLKREQVR